MIVAWGPAQSSIIPLNPKTGQAKWLDQHLGSDKFVIPCPHGLEKLDVCDKNGLGW
jgi:glucose dehydrogenase